MDTLAKLNDANNSPRKMRLLADLVRGMAADKALFVLKTHPKRTYSILLEKLLRSAIANWSAKNTDLSLEDSGLYIKTITVDGGRVLKRVLPAPQGRAHRVRKRSNHVTLILSEKTPVSTIQEVPAIEEKPKKVRAPRKTATKKTEE